jgi:hypothetical protein
MNKLSDRLVSEARTKVLDFWPNDDEITQTVLREVDQIILHTIEETIKDGCKENEFNPEDEINKQNAVFRLVCELLEIEKPNSHHIDELVKNIDEVYLFFARKDGGRLHFTKLSERVTKSPTPSTLLEG